MSVLKLNIGTQVMLTTNINLDDRLVNGLVDLVKTIFIDFTDENVGVTTMTSDLRAWQCH